MVKAIPVTDRAGLYGYEMLRIPHCLDSWLILKQRRCSTPQKQHFSTSDIYFC
jgi:hypothetical protein